MQNDFTGHTTHRCQTVVVGLVDVIKQYLTAHDVTLHEYRAARCWLGRLAASGESEMLLDVLFESTVERSEFAGLPGSVGAMQGPYRLEHDRLTPPYRLPLLPDEDGQPIVFSGLVTDLSGSPLGGATVDVWQSDSQGRYSGFAPGVPEGTLRGVMETDTDGRFEFVSVRPANYRVPDQGLLGEYLTMAGSHSWRPAHFHFALGKDGYDPLVTQIYLRGDAVLDSIGDCVDGVKDELIVDVGLGRDRDTCERYGIDGEYETVTYMWQLRPRLGSAKRMMP